MFRFIFLQGPSFCKAKTQNTFLPNKDGRATKCKKAQVLYFKKQNVVFFLSNVDFTNTKFSIVFSMEIFIVDFYKPDIFMK